MDDKKSFDVISTFDQLDELNDRYEQTYGIEPFNLSYWDPSDDFSKKMLPYIKMKFPPNALNYIFTYQIENIKKQLLINLGLDPNIKDMIFTTNGTTSIMMVINWVKMKGYTKLHIVCPVYFSLFNNCQKEGIEIIKHGINYITGDFLEINSNDYKNEIFWITNPIYSLGNHLNNKNLNTIKNLLENNIVIVDDCLAYKDKEISRTFGYHQNFIGIFAPHKSICVNGLKFSAVIFNKEYESFFDKSVDFLCGGLNIASVAAINNYLDGSYDIYRGKFQEYINDTHDFIKNVCKTLPQAHYYNEDKHYLASICFPHIKYELGGNKDFIWNAMDNTGSIFITGFFNNYPCESGFSFRINMARDSAIFRSTLTRLLLYLANYSLKE